MELYLSLTSDSMASSYILSGQTEPRIVLYAFEDAPWFVAQNPFIRHGYRAFLPYALCLKSSLTWNNDTLNIWTHVFGFLYYARLMYYFNTDVLPNTSHTTSLDCLIGNAALLSFQICMLLSAFYHCFYCHSEPASEKWLGLDLSGIICATLGCYLSAICYGFYCRPFWKIVYLSCVGILSIVTLALPSMYRWYLKPEGMRIRITLHLIVIGFHVIPMTHFFFAEGGFSSKWVKRILPKVFFMYFSLSSSFLFYILEIPERFFPGYLDYIGHGHQLWHVGIFVSMAYWYDSFIYVMQDRIAEHCGMDESTFWEMAI
jgi:predicted membrane channel-forming protein YqfA (hemolysin III family)